MRYENAARLLPAALLARVQKYCDGCVIYIPKKGEKLSWGHGNGTKRIYDARNSVIANERRQGSSVKELSEKYCLCEDSIRKIIRKKRQKP